MIYEILHRYLTVIVACAALLLGLQLPNLADQYEKRVDAHLREVTVNFQPFQDIANKYFNGSIEKLVDLHRQSGQKPFQDEGDAIEKMYKRKLRFTAEMEALNTTLPYKIAHILFSNDSEMMDETLAQYTYNVQLNEDALVVGAVVTIVILLVLELLLAVVRLGARAALRLKRS